MPSLFAVFITHGAAWQPGRALEEQEAWRPHADFMNSLLAERFVVLGGPLQVEGKHDVPLIIRANTEAEMEERLAADPCTGPTRLRIARISCGGRSDWGNCRKGARPLPIRRIQRDVLGDSAFPTVAVREQALLVVVELLAGFGGELEVLRPLDDRVHRAGFLA